MKMSPKKTNYNFMGMGKYAIIFSSLLIVLTVFVWIQRGTTKYGTDYSGGFEFVVQLDKSVDTDGNVKLRKAFEEKGFENVVVQSYDVGGGKYAVRLPGDAAQLATNANSEDNKYLEETTGKAKEALNSTFGEKNVTMLSNAYIGPTIGSELQKKALIAFIFGLLGITAYISYRFEFAFALGAVVAVFHDAIVTLGLYLALGHEINMTILAAVLTIVGYSVNDTIVIFDRVREEVFKRKDYDLVALMNECINATLSRTIITSLSTLFAAVALLTLGGGAIRDLSLFMTIGLVVGTYSTVFIASPIVVLWWKKVMLRNKSAEA